MKRMLSVAALIVLTGCSIPEHRLSSVFDAGKTRAAIQPGGGKIEGTAFLRQQGGGVVTCAGSEVKLVPVSDYSSERMSKIYGKSPGVGETVAQSAWEAAHYRIRFVPENEDYARFSRGTRCDAQGEFEFAGVKDGKYFVVTTVAGRVQSLQGAVLATQVNVVNGKADRAIMTH